MLFRLPTCIGALTLIGTSLAAAQQTVTTPGAWTVTTTFSRDGQMIHQKMYLLELLDKGDRWLLVQTSKGPDAGVDSSWLSKPELRIISQRVVGPMTSQIAVQENRVTGSMRHPDGSEMRVDFVVDSLPYDHASLPFLLARRSLRPGAIMRFPVLNVHGQKLDWVTVTLSPDAENQIGDELPLDGKIGDLAMRIVLNRKTKEFLRVSGSGQNGMQFLATYEKVK